MCNLDRLTTGSPDRSGLTRRGFLSAVTLLPLLQPDAMSLLARSQRGAVEIQIESPAPDSAVSGAVDVIGWAFDASATADFGIQTVLVYAGGDAGTGTPLGEARIGLERPDLVARFGDPRRLRSGFQFTWDTASLAPGPTQLVVYARTPSGDWAAASMTVRIERARTAAVTAALGLDLVEVTSPVAPGATARLTARTEASAACALLLVGPNGPVGWRGLGPISADASGLARWEFPIPPAAPRGAYDIAVVATLGQQLATARGRLTVG